MALDKENLLNVIKTEFPDFQIYEHRNQLTIIVQKEQIVGFCQLLRDNPSTSFDMLIDITAIDWLDREPRYEVVYFLYSNRNKSRVRIKVAVSGENPVCPTVTSVWESANWYERETFDMYGIKFEGHPGLRRFYMPEDYNDPSSGEPLYPLRKDFPLMGVPDSLPLPPYTEKFGELK
ncbi:MAG: dehydrogenase subunit [Ignavibacteria bacterium]|nr:dehydrogenase subunit [Ignavibacteria bacterium]